MKIKELCEAFFCLLVVVSGFGLLAAAIGAGIGLVAGSVSWAYSLMIGL